jgi:hypothetical protein
LNDGVLSLVLPKVEEAKPRTSQITGGRSWRSPVGDKSTLDDEVAERVDRGQLLPSRQRDDFDIANDRHSRLLRPRCQRPRRDQRRSRRRRIVFAKPFVT